MKTTTNIIYPALALFAFADFALSPQARAVCQDACLTNSNTVQGDDALISLTTGTDNTAIGFDALFSLTDGSQDTATGSLALANDTGGNNTAFGFSALNANTTGQFNTATGRNALLSNTTGISNTATGSAALLSNTIGTDNTATGRDALIDNTTGSFNTATGRNALFSNTTGTENTATGSAALFGNTIGNFNTATGRAALGSNTEGSGNTANGYFAFSSNTIGNGNTAVGNQALFSNTTGNSNIAVGDSAGTNLTTGDNNIDIGNLGVAAESNTIRIGTQGTQTRTFIAGISGASGTGTPVVINSNGRLGTAPCSARYKDEIKPMDAASEVILALKPVTFRYKKEIDADRTPRFGLIAEDVEKVNPDLVSRDADGKAYTVRYDAVNAMLLSEFLKEHRKVEELENTVAALVTTVREQASQIQKVSAQLQLQRPATRVVKGRERLTSIALGGSGEPPLPVDRQK